MRKYLLLAGYVLGNFAIVVWAVLLLSLAVSQKSMANGSTGADTIVASGYESFAAVVSSGPSMQVDVVAADSRAVLVDQYFSAYHSPMAGLGADVVSAADKYHLPFGLLPAIAMCEGNLGKEIPEGSFNSYGWAIYGQTVTKFISWEDGIEKVSRGLRKNYFDRGLTSPDKIMTKYTPNSNGSWAKCVDEFLSEIK